MARSTYTNALIRKIVSEANEHSLKIRVHDGEEWLKCKTFREIADIVDSVDDSTIKIFGPLRNAWFEISLMNEGDEQLIDYLYNDYTESIVNSIELTGEE